MDAFDIESPAGSLTPLHWVGIALAVVTGLVHLGLGLATVPDPLGVASVLAAAGYAGAIGLVLVGYRRRLVVALGVPYVGSQVLLWYLLNRPSGPGDVSATAAVDKTVQLLLVGLLVVLLVRGS
jgi:hypothetical protein